MTQATDSSASATLSGRDLALKRRQAMSRHGKTAAGKSVAQSKPAAPRATAQVIAPAPAVETAPRATASDAALFEQLKNVATKSASRARREALSLSGKAALQNTSNRPTGRARPSRQAVTLDTTATVAVVDASATQSCGCGCNGQPGGCGAQSSADAGLRQAAEVTIVAAKSVEAPTGRALARARRAALSQDGKSGLKRVAQATKIAASMPGQDWQAAITKGATGRQVAMQRRLVQSIAGKTGASNDSARPSGRMRARNTTTAPEKVGEGHTLAGQAVTGTMVDRSKKVTGNEPGSCRAVTGTEYIGSEQFDTLCQSRPQANPSKVGVTSTITGHKVTGTEVGRSATVTGDEVGACRGITGTEYLSAERYDEFCATRPAPAAPKIGVTETQKGKTLTGTLVGRSTKVTGDEPGSGRAITGTNYAKPAGGAASPEKVVVTHTAQGKQVTGTAVGHTAKITGDEPGACRGITGTEYLAAEQFQAGCNTAPLATPRKVSVMSTRDSQQVSGTEVGRSGLVTGDEQGSCRQITGSQYYNSGDFGSLCNASYPRKVAAMETLAGRTVTGTEVKQSPKMSGDVEGGCIPVTGIDYVGAEQLQAACPSSTPVAPIAKIVVDQTWRGQAVSGSYVGRSSKVTGADAGGCAPISGTPYVGRDQYAGFCEAPAIEAQASRVRFSTVIPAAAVTGDRPGAGGSVMTGDERGACEVVSGTPYVGPDNAVSSCLTSGRFVSRAQTWEEPVRAPAPLDFSIVSPAREAYERRTGGVTGTGYNSERITGPVNKAAGLITGTPEFRHRDTQTQQTAQAENIAAARRLTGEGSQAGARITGDAWHAQSRVTGTEGASSLARNMSVRGQPRGAGVNAQQFRDIERPEIPESRITGSAGNTGKGAVVTLSGGARG